MVDVRCFLALSLALVVLPAAATAGPPPRPAFLAPGNYEYTKAQGDWLVHEAMKKHKLQGVSVALVDDRHLVWAEGFGFADKANKVAATPDTVYRAGALAKLFTVTAALQLAEQGRLGLDRPLTESVPGFAMRSRFPAAPPLTLRTLMTHHSGLPSDRLRGAWTDTPAPLAALPDLMRDEYVASPPGLAFSYSNVGMSLVGLAVQNAGGREFVQTVTQGILRPLGMDASSFSSRPPHGPYASKAYDDGAEAFEPPLRDVPSGGLNASAADLARFLEMVLGEGQRDGKRVLRADSVREMFRAQNGGIPLDLDYRQGLGWALTGLGAIELPQAAVVGHVTGATLYHRAALVCLPEEKLGVVVLCNSRAGPNVVTNLAAELLTLALETKTGRPPPVRKPLETGPYLSQEELRAYAGDYATVGGLLRLTVERDHLSARYQDRTFRLAPRSDKKLEPQYRLLGFIPVNLGELGTYGLERKVVAGREVLCASSGRHEFLFGERVAPAPIPPAWRHRLGKYDFVGVPDDVRMFDKVVLRELDGLLTVEFVLTGAGNMLMVNVLKPLSDTEAVSAGLGRGMGETVRAAPGHDGEVLHYSGYELKKRP